MKLSEINTYILTAEDSKGAIVAAKTWCGDLHRGITQFKTDLLIKNKRGIKITADPVANR